MTPFLRKIHTNDFDVFDGEVRVGRIYRDTIHGNPKWRWFLQTVPAPTPNQGLADTLNQAKAAFKLRYQQLTRPPQRRFRG